MTHIAIVANQYFVSFQLLCLVSILKDEWRNVEGSKDELDGSFVIEEICSLEKTYINCHAYLADTLLSEVYTNNNSLSECLELNFLITIEFECLNFSYSGWSICCIQLFKAILSFF